jgi:predicted RNase H-like nuclease (RuvC/YqgF family)
MDKTTFLKDFKNLIKRLDKIDLEFKKENLNWDTVEKYLEEIRDLHKKLAEFYPKLETLQQSDNSDFRIKYKSLKENGLKNIKMISDKIRDWIEQQRTKISQSTDTIKNIKRYNPEQKTSYYIDKKK